VSTAAKKETDVKEKITTGINDRSIDQTIAQNGEGLANDSS
jgi:hypothetical protein